MVGVVVIVVVMALAAPVAFFVVGALWSALLGWTLADDADARVSTT